MELLVLGSGHFTAPDPRWAGATVRNPSGYALKVDGELLLFDLGFGNSRQLARGSWDYLDVSHVFFSHHHLDHIGDISSLLFGYRYGPKPRTGRLDLYGPFGFEDFNKRLRRAHGTYVEPEDYSLGIHELKEGATIKGKGWRVHTLSVPHSTDTFAYRFEKGGKTMVYSGDLGFDERFIDFAKGADLLILECTQPDDDPFRGHLTKSEALYMARETKAKRVVMTHLTHPSEMDLRRELGNHPNPKIILAEDLLKLKL